MISKSLARIRKREQEDREHRNIILGIMSMAIGIMTFFSGSSLQFGVYYGSHMIFNLLFIYGGASIIVDPFSEIKKQKSNNIFEFILITIGVLSIAIGIIGFIFGVSWRPDLELAYWRNDIILIWAFVLGGAFVAIKSLVKIKKRAETYPYEFIRLVAGILGIIVGTIIFVINIL